MLEIQSGKPYHVLVFPCNLAAGQGLAFVPVNLISRCTHVALWHRRALERDAGWDEEEKSSCDRLRGSLVWGAEPEWRTEGWCTGEGEEGSLAWSGGGGLVSLLCLSQWAFDQPACGIRRSINQFTFLSSSYTDELHEILPALDEMELWLARWGNGSSVVVGKLSFGWLVGAATCHAFLDPSLVSERGDMRKQEMSFSWNSLPVLKFPPEHCGPDGVSAL